jgi:hypothetical protein
MQRSVEYIKEIASPINARFVADTDQLAAKLISGTRVMPSFKFWERVEGK